MRRFIWWTGFWPGEALGEKRYLFVKWHKVQMIVQHVIAFLGQVIYVTVFFSHITFLEAGMIYITASLTFLVVIRCCLPSLKKYNRFLKTFLTEFHLINYKQNGDYQIKVVSELDKMSHYCVLYHMAMILIIPIAFNAAPIYNSYKAGAFSGRSLEGLDLEFSTYFHFPGFNCFDHFYTLTVLNYYLTSNGCVAIFAIDCFLSLIILQIIGHIRILTYNMHNLPRPKQEILVHVPGEMSNVSLSWYDEDENKNIRSVLVDMIKHHKYITRYVGEVSSLFGLTLGINYIFHLVNLCVLLLECIRCEPDDLVRNMCVLGVSLVNLVISSVFFEVVGAYSEKLIDAVYGMPWESMNVSNRKMLKLFLSRVQDPIRVTTMGVVSVGVQTMGAILRTSLSYCTFLLTIE